MNHTSSTQNRHFIPSNVATSGSLAGEQHRQAATTAKPNRKTRVILGHVKNKQWTLCTDSCCVSSFKFSSFKYFHLF